MRWELELRAGGRGAEGIEVDPKRRSLSHDESDLVLETVEERETFITKLGEGRKIVKKVEELREAKATTLKRVRLARSCVIGGEGRGGRG
jgi:hypothetical protein